MTDHAVLIITRRVLLVVVLAIQLVLMLPQLIAYPHGPAAWVAYVLLTSVLGIVAGNVAAVRPTLPAWLAVAPLAASVLATTALPAGASFGPEDWGFGLVGWYLLLVLVERPAM